MKGGRAAALGVAALISGCAATALSVAAPLAVYSVTLAVFGLPHVLSELRYVDRRFGRQLGVRTVAAMALLLGAIAVCRIAGVLGALAPQTEQPLELGLVAALALTAARGQLATSLVALVIALAIGALAIADPFEAIVVFAVLHNLTPLGFLWQLAPSNRRGPVMGVGATVLLGMPLLVATGAMRALVAPFVGSAQFDPIGAGPLAANLAVYVPHGVLTGAGAIDLFTAAVVAQQGHYAAVIVVLPWLLSRWSPGAQGLVLWPRGAIFYALVAGAGALAFLGFTVDFVGARAVYGIAAAIHAWVEIPILVIALGSVQTSSSSSPTAKEAPLVTSDSSMA